LNIVLKIMKKLVIIFVLRYLKCDSSDLIVKIVIYDLMIVVLILNEL
jgi:hypothetical protein